MRSTVFFLNINNLKKKAEFHLFSSSFLLLEKKNSNKTERETKVRQKRRHFAVSNVSFSSTTNDFFFLGGGRFSLRKKFEKKWKKMRVFLFFFFFFRVSLFLSFDDQSGAFSSVIIGHPEVSHRGHFRYRVFFCFYRLLLSQFSLMFTSFTEFPQAERGFT